MMLTLNNNDQHSTHNRLLLPPVITYLLVHVLLQVPQHHVQVGSSSNNLTTVNKSEYCHQDKITHWFINISSVHLEVIEGGHEMV